MPRRYARLSRAQLWLLLSSIPLIPVIWISIWWFTLPRYNGETIHYWWHRGTHRPFQRPFPNTFEEVRVAFREMSPQSARFVIRKAATSVSPSLYEQFLIQNWHRVPKIVSKILPFPENRGANRYLAEQLLIACPELAGAAPPAIARLFSHRNPAVALEALKLLNIIGDRATNVLVELESAIIRQTVPASKGIEFLLRFDRSPATCIDALGEELSNIREPQYDALACIQTLPEFRSRLVPYLGKALNNQEPRFCAMVMKSIGEAGTNAAPVVPALIQSLNNPWYFVRAESAKALGKIGSAAKPALPKLASLSGDQHSDVVSASREAIAAIQGQ